MGHGNLDPFVLCSMIPRGVNIWPRAVFIEEGNKALEKEEGPEYKWLQNACISIL